jgi:SAM-dependent methyltransferase
MVIDPAIETHYRTGYERSRLFPGGQPSLEYVRSMELLERLLPTPPARVLDAGGGPGTYAAPLARRGYRVHLVDPVPLHVDQARQASGADPAARFTVALGDARELAEPDASQDAVLLFGPLYHLTEAGQRRQALAQARRVLAPGGRLLAMAVSRFASLLDGLYADWLDDPVFRPIVDQDLADGQHRNPDPAAVLHHCLLPYPRWSGRRDRPGWLHRRDRLRSRGPRLSAHMPVGKIILPDT